MTLTHYEREIVYFSLVGPAALSVFASFLIIAIYFTHSHLRRKNTFNLVFVMACFDLINGISFLVPSFNATDTSWNCQTQAILFNFSSAGAIIWSTFIAIYLYLGLVTSYIFKPKGIFIGALFTFVVGTLSTLINLGFKTYGKTESLCWIQEKNTFFRVGFFFAPLWMIVMINSYIYAKLRIKLAFSIIEDSVKLKLNRKLKFYPLVLIFCYLPYSVKAGLETFGVFAAEVELSSLAAVCRCLHGFLNFTLYGLTNPVKKIFRKRKSRSINGCLINF